MRSRVFLVLSICAATATGSCEITASSTNQAQGRACHEIPLASNLTETQRAKVTAERRKIKCPKVYGSIFNRIAGDLDLIARLLLNLQVSPQPAKNLEAEMETLRAALEHFCSVYKNTPEISPQAWLCMQEKLLAYQQEVAAARSRAEKSVTTGPSLPKAQPESRKVASVSEIHETLGQLARSAGELSRTVTALEEKAQK